MGGDFGPESVVPGAALALKARADLHFLIFGDEARIQPLLDRNPALMSASTLIHTDKMIHSDDKPSNILRASKGTSMRLAIESVQTGQALAVVSSGNTGALMALAKLVLKPLHGIHRPALASILPAQGGETVMLDLGANVLVDAESLVQFAVLGAVFAKLHKKIERPTVGLLNVGSEEMKGPEHVREAGQILSRISFPGIYKGFVEGNDITQGTVDVVVCDGYAGNIALKSIEGVGKLTRYYFKKFMTHNLLGILGSLIAYCSLKNFKDKLDPRRYNGGVFLGLNGICIKSHGGTDPVGFARAIHLAAELATQGYIDEVARDINRLMNQESFVSQGIS